MTEVTEWFEGYFQVDLAAVLSTEGVQGVRSLERV
jgi:hypothetical protein